MFESIIQPIVDWFTDPFWGYLAWCALIIAVASVIGWFFAPVRSFAGAVVLTVIGMLFAYRRGRSDEKEKQERRQPRQAQDTWWRW